MDNPLADVQAAAKCLIGRSLLGVRYYEMPFGLVDREPWDMDQAHVVDYGLDLMTDKGTVGVTWTMYDRFGYGLRVVPSSLLDLRENAVQVVHVGSSAPWCDVQTTAITDAVVHGYSVAWGSQEAATAPVALTLRFADGQSIGLVCGGWTGPGEVVFLTGDDIIVLWARETLPALVPDLADGLLPA